MPSSGLLYGLSTKAEEMNIVDFRFQSSAAGNPTDGMIYRVDANAGQFDSRSDARRWAICAGDAASVYHLWVGLSGSGQLCVGRIGVEPFLESFAGDGAGCFVQLFSWVLPVSNSRGDLRGKAERQAAGFLGASALGRIVWSDRRGSKCAAADRGSDASRRCRRRCVAGDVDLSNALVSAWRAVSRQYVIDADQSSHDGHCVGSLRRIDSAFRQSSARAVSGVADDVHRRRFAVDCVGVLLDGAGG